ncbi:M14 family metallopeptidase [Oscillatoria amoena NRMC-F 0135]|nr:M14 family metallopeptidase [Oscillatoria amoena NRMC-F 0135]
MKILHLFSCLLVAYSGFNQPSYFYPQAKAFNSQIPTPEQFLGYAIGTHHTRHDKVVEYFKTLDGLSDRMTLLEIGKTHEHRPQITAIITSPENHINLEDIRQKHLQRNTSTSYNNVPLVILLGYNVHGNEPSSTEAAMLTAYYLVASDDDETRNWLNNMVILLDPVYNPDGRDRHSHWANMHKASALAGDPLDREHNEVWPGGRTNHYWFDLNRDWFLGVHPESRNRLNLFHQWRPYVMTDHHEMGTNSTFYFDPGKNSSNNPIVPSQLYDVLYPKFGAYFAKAMDGIGSQYFTKEAFDKLYPGYGSSYVNFYGGAGFLFEQASSRGHLQETTTIPITFAFTIRNQFTASLATIRASIAERETLINLRLNFFKTAAGQAKSNPVKGYVFGDACDLSRTYAFVNLLRMHDIEVYDLPRDMAVSGRNYEKGKAFVVPTEQTNYIMVRSAFEKEITYTDSIFYDASTWSLVHAFNMPHNEIRGLVTKGDRITKDLQKTTASVAQSQYAYLIEQTDYQSHKVIYQLQQEDVIVKTAFKPFSARINEKEKSFRAGTLIIPVQQQTLDATQLHEKIKKVSSACSADVFSVETGYNLKGIDLGSGFAVPLKKVTAAMLTGNGVSGYEAGEVWHLLDQRIGMPITKIDVANIGRVNWNKYNVLVMVSGTYTLDKPTTDKIKTWIQNGGTLITFKTASEWAIKQGVSKEKLVPTDTVKNKPRANYEDAANLEGARNIGGSIFQVDLDITNPIGFGYTDRNVSLYRNGLTFLQPSKNPYTTVAKYKANPLIGGYLHKASAPKVANSAAVLLSGDGQGRIILFSDNPNFRGTWYGTNKMFLNALFFGPVTGVPTSNPSE